MWEDYVTWLLCRHHLQIRQRSTNCLQTAGSARVLFEVYSIYTAKVSNKTLYSGFIYWCQTMFKVHNLTTPALLSKISTINSSKSKRSRNSSPSVSLGLIHAIGATTDDQQELCIIKPKLPRISDAKVEDNCVTDDGCCFAGQSLSASVESHIWSKYYDPSHAEKLASSSGSRPFHPHYPKESVFKAALELYNRQLELSWENGAGEGSSKNQQRWECKGQIQASFQLCVLCKDIGKVKCSREKYYLNVLEVRKYRTILCKVCLGFLLSQNVGACAAQIQRRLKEFESKRIPKEWSNIDSLLSRFHWLFISLL